MLKKYGTFGDTFVSSPSHMKANSRELNTDGIDNRSREKAREAIKNSRKIKQRI